MGSFVGELVIRTWAGVLLAFWEKYPRKRRGAFLKCLCLAVALGLIFSQSFVLSLVPTSSEVFTLHLKK